MENETWEQRIDRERSEKKAAYDALYKGVAEHLPGWRLALPDDWDETDPYRYERMRLASDTKGQGISLTIDRGKVNVSGYWPQSSEHGAYVAPYQVREESPGISVTLARGYETIAREITRRFLPEYLRIWQKCCERIAADNAYEDTKTANWQRIAASPVLQVWKNNHSTEPKAHLCLKNGYGDVNMESKDSVRLEIRSVSVDVALAVLKALEAFREEK